MLFGMPKDDVFQFKKKIVLEGVLFFITKNEAKLDKHVCSNWPKTARKTTEKICPIQSADIHTTSC